MRAEMYIVCGPAPDFLVACGGGMGGWRRGRLTRMWVGGRGGGLGGGAEEKGGVCSRSGSELGVGWGEGIVDDGGGGGGGGGGRQREL